MGWVESGIEKWTDGQLWDTVTAHKLCTTSWSIVNTRTDNNIRNKKASNLELAKERLRFAASAAVDTIHFECFHLTHRWEVRTNLTTSNRMQMMISFDIVYNNEPSPLLVIFMPLLPLYAVSVLNVEEFPEMKKKAGPLEIFASPQVKYCGPK